MTHTSRILIIDSKKKSADILKSILEKEGIIVSIAETKNAACSCINNELPNLILIDVSNVDFDGTEICGEISKVQNDHNIPIIYIASKTNPNDIINAFRSGIADYIVKPFETEEFVCRIQTQLQLIEAKTKIEKQNLELIELNAIKNKLFSVIAHDLRGPLGNFKSIVNIVIKHIEHNPASVKELLVSVQESANNTYGLLENLLHWSRSQQNQISLNPTIFNFQEIVYDTFNLYKQEALKKKIVLENNVVDKVNCLADKDMIFIVLRNLVSNAIKFTKENGSVAVSVKTQEKTIKISVKDTGVGMNNDIANSLFNKTTYSTTWGTGYEKGTGIGLQLCFDLVKMHDSDIHITSQEGIGSEFSFELPSV